MPERRVLEHALRRILWELRAYLGDVVVIGGWVPYLYQRYGPFPAWRGRLALTAEVDVLVTPELPPGDRPTLAEILRASGFRPMGASGTGRSAAVWAHDPERGEKIEFLVPHTGTYRTIGRVVPVRAQDVGAIALTALDLLARHTGAVAVPAESADGLTALVEIRVPRLGAYVLNKATTFADRAPLAGGRENPKRAKDLLYLRDVMAGGADVVAAVERDLAQIEATDRRGQFQLDRAVSHLDGVLRNQPFVLERVGAMLAEREPTLHVSAAAADVAGHVMDLYELLATIHPLAPRPRRPTRKARQMSVRDRTVRRRRRATHPNGLASDSPWSGEAGAHDQPGGTCRRIGHAAGDPPRRRRGTALRAPSRTCGAAPTRRATHPPAGRVVIPHRGVCDRVAGAVLSLAPDQWQYGVARSFMATRRAMARHVGPAGGHYRPPGYRSSGVGPFILVRSRRRPRRAHRLRHGGRRKGADGRRMPVR